MKIAGLGLIPILGACSSPQSVFPIAGHEQSLEAGASSSSVVIEKPTWVRYEDQHVDWVEPHDDLRYCPPKKIHNPRPLNCTLYGDLDQPLHIPSIDGATVYLDAATPVTLVMTPADSYSEDITWQVALLKTRERHWLGTGEWSGRVPKVCAVAKEGQLVGVFTQDKLASFVEYSYWFDDECDVFEKQALSGHYGYARSSPKQGRPDSVPLFIAVIEKAAETISERNR